MIEKCFIFSSIKKIWKKKFNYSLQNYTYTIKFSDIFLLLLKYLNINFPFLFGQQYMFYVQIDSRDFFWCINKLYFINLSQSFDISDFDWYLMCYLHMIFNKKLFPKCAFRKFYLKAFVLEILLFLVLLKPVRTCLLKPASLINFTVHFWDEIQK